MSCIALLCDFQAKFDKTQIYCTVLTFIVFSLFFSFDIYYRGVLLCYFTKVHLFILSIKKFSAICITCEFGFIKCIERFKGYCVFSHSV